MLAPTQGEASDTETKQSHGAGFRDRRRTGGDESNVVEANPIPVKWALQQLGLIEAGIRLPLTPLDERYQEQVKAALEAAGI